MTKQQMQKELAEALHTVGSWKELLDKAKALAEHRMTSPVGRANPRT